MPEIVLLCSEAFLVLLVAADGLFCRKKYPRVRANWRGTKTECIWISPQ